MLENFFWRRNAADLLSVRDKAVISDHDRRKLVNELVDFMIQSFGIDMEKTQKEVTAKASIILFPALAYKLSIDQTVSLLNRWKIIEALLNGERFPKFHRICCWVNADISIEDWPISSNARKKTWIKRADQKKIVHHMNRQTKTKTWNSWKMLQLTSTTSSRSSKNWTQLVRCAGVCC